MILLSYDLIGNFMNNGQASHFFLDIQLLKSWELWVGYQLALNTLSPCICLHVILVYKYHKSSNELYTMYPSSQVSTSPPPPTFLFFFCVFLYGNWDIVDCVCNHQCPGFFCFALTYLLDNIITMQETSFFSSKLQCTISRSNLHVVCVKSLLSFIQTFCMQLSHFWFSCFLFLFVICINFVNVITDVILSCSSHKCYMVLTKNKHPLDFGPDLNALAALHVIS